MRTPADTCAMREMNSRSCEADECEECGCVFPSPLLPATCSFVRFRLAFATLCVLKTGCTAVYGAARCHVPGKRQRQRLGRRCGRDGGRSPGALARRCARQRRAMN